MTRAPGELLRDVAKALAGYASLKHTQSKFPQHPGIQAALLEEAAYIEALEREVRDAAQAQAGVRDSLTTAQESLPVEITWDAAVDRLMQGGNLVLTARAEDIATLSAVVATVAECLELGELEGHDETANWGVWFRAALAQAQAGAGSEGGEAQ